MFKFKNNYFILLLFVFISKNLFSEIDIKNTDLRTKDYNYYSVFIDESEYSRDGLWAISSAFVDAIYSIDYEDGKALESDFNKKYSIIVSESLVVKLKKDKNLIIYHDFLIKNYSLFFFKEKEYHFIVCIPKIESRDKDTALSELGYASFLSGYKVLDPLGYIPPKNKSSSDDFIGLFDSKNKFPKIFFMEGHGYYNKYVVGINLEEFKKNLVSFVGLNLKLLYLTSCYSGGVTSDFIKNLVVPAWEKDINFFIIIKNAFESLSYAKAPFFAFLSKLERYFYERCAFILSRSKAESKSININQELLSSFGASVVLPKNCESYKDPGLFNFKSFNDYLMQSVYISTDIRFEHIPKILDFKMKYWILPKELYNIRIIRNRLPNSEINVSEKFKNLVIFNAEWTKSIKIKLSSEIFTKNSFNKIVLISNKNNIDIDSIKFVSLDGGIVHLYEDDLKYLFDTPLNSGKNIKVGNYEFEIFSGGYGVYVDPQAISSVEVSLFIKNAEGELVFDFDSANLDYLAKTFVKPESRSLRKRVEKEALEKLKDETLDNDKKFKVFQVLASALQVPTAIYLVKNPKSLNEYIEYGYYEALNYFFKNKIAVDYVTELLQSKIKKNQVSIDNDKVVSQIVKNDMVVSEMVKKASELLKNSANNQELGNTGAKLFKILVKNHKGVDEFVRIMNSYMRKPLYFELVETIIYLKENKIPTSIAWKSQNLLRIASSYLKSNQKMYDELGEKLLDVLIKDDTGIQGVMAGIKDLLLDLDSIYNEYGLCIFKFLIKRNKCVTSLIALASNLLNGLNEKESDLGLKLFYILVENDNAIKEIRNMGLDIVVNLADLKANWNETYTSRSFKRKVIVGDLDVKLKQNSILKLEDVIFTGSFRFGKFEIPPCSCFIFKNVIFKDSWGKKVTGIFKSTAALKEFILYPIKE